MRVYNKSFTWPRPAGRAPKNKPFFAHVRELMPDRRLSVYLSRRRPSPKGPNSYALGAAAGHMTPHTF